jgi:hypothetical protein
MKPDELRLVPNTTPVLLFVSIFIFLSIFLNVVQLAEIVHALKRNTPGSGHGITWFPSWPCSCWRPLERGQGREWEPRECSPPS